MAWVAVAGAATSAVVGGLFNSGGGSGGGGGGGGPGYDPALASEQAYALKQQSGIAGKQWDNYVANYQPLIPKVVGAGAEINSPEAVARLQGQVNADNTAAFDSTRRAATGRQRGFGVNPASGAAVDADNTMALAEASSKAAGVNAVKPALDAQARQYNFDALNAGSGMPASSMAGFGASAAGAGALQNANTNAANSAFNRNITGSYMRGQAAAPFVNAAQSWFKKQSFGGGGDGINYGTSQPSGGGGGWGTTADYANSPGYSDAPMSYYGGSQADGGPVRRRGMGVRMADGGPMPDDDGMYPDGSLAESGGEVEGVGTGTSDSINTDLSDGEFVIPADVVRAKGEEFFNRLIDQYHTPVNRPNPGDMKAAKSSGGGFGIRRA